MPFPAERISSPFDQSETIPVALSFMRKKKETPFTFGSLTVTSIIISCGSHFRRSIGVERVILANRLPSIVCVAVAVASGAGVGLGRASTGITVAVAPGVGGGFVACAQAASIKNRPSKTNPDLIIVSLEIV